MSNSSPFQRIVDGLKDQAKDALYALSSCICQRTAKMKINGRTFQIVKVLGEGGFSFVYLAQDDLSRRQFALKKIRCPTGNDGVREAMREIEAYRRFKHPNIIRILDSAVVQDPDGEGKVVYLFLPLYKRGNLQDAINANVVNRTHFPEKQMALWFKGTCEAVRAMHTYRAPVRAGVQNGNGNGNGSASASQGRSPLQGKHKLPTPEHHSDDDDDDDRFPQPEGDGDGGYSYGSAGGSGGGGNGADSVPLMSKRQNNGEVVFDEAEESSHLDGEGESGSGETVLCPYAHRDIKPGNVMLTDEGLPILMDFGSTIPARIEVQTRSQALAQQDLAAEQSTMTYRAPELFDVKTGTTLDEKVDIWSLGCTLYALAYSHSPFENTQTTEQGGSIAMAVLNAQYKHPASAYSQGMKNLIDAMLKPNPKDRLDIHQVLRLIERVLQSVS